MLNQVVFSTLRKGLPAGRAATPPRRTTEVRGKRTLPIRPPGSSRGGQERPGRRREAGMGRGRRCIAIGVDTAGLERRDLLSLTAPLASQTGPTTALPDVFHRNGINGLKIHKAFDVQMNDRFAKATDSAHRVFEAFTVFNQAYLQI